MLNPQLIWIGLAINLAAGVAVVVHAVRANLAARRGAPPDLGVQPNRVTWGVWAVTAWIAFAGQISQGVQQAAALTAVVAIVPTLVLAATFINQRQPWTDSPLDKICLALSALALLLWQLTASGDVAIALSILVDAIAAVPTLVKAYQAPETEGASVYTAGILSGGLTLLTLEHYTFATAGFALYFLALCTIMSVLLLVVPPLRNTRPRHHRHPSTTEPAAPPAGWASIAAFAGAYAADYLSWDALDPPRRGIALAAYLHATPPEVAAFLGWDGHGRQRVDLVLLGDVDQHPGTSDYAVDVRVRYTPYLPDPTNPPPSTPDQPRANGHRPARPSDAVVSAAPTPTAPGWRAAASCWIRLSIRVRVLGGALVVLPDHHATVPNAQPRTAPWPVPPPSDGAREDRQHDVPWLTDQPR